MNNVRNIYITGDTHGTYDITKLYMFCKEQEKKGNSLIKNDIVIIAGDVAFF